MSSVTRPRLPRRDFGSPRGRAEQTIAERPGNRDRTAAQHETVITILAPSEVAGRRVELALAAASLPARASERTVARVIQLGAPDLLVVVSGRSLSERRATLSRLTKRFQGVYIVVVGPADTRSAVRTTIESGANGLVFETDIERSLAASVAAVLAGQVVVPAEGRRDLDPPTLSGREKQVLALVVLGQSNREIASQLFLAESTVKCHLSSAFIKLGVRSRNEAATRILEPGGNLGLGILGISREATLATSELA